jgi:hypothetical protein
MRVGKVDERLGNNEELCKIPTFEDAGAEGLILAQLWLRR